MRRAIPCSLFLVVLSALPAAAADPARTITVRGKAEVVFPAESVIVHTGVVAKAGDARGAQLQAREKVAKILSYLEKAGLSGTDVATDRIQLREHSEPVDEDHPRKSPQTYFEATVDVRFEVHNLTKYDNLLAGIMELGLNRIYGISSESSARTAKAKEARILAVLAAKEKADYLARQLGMTVGLPVTVEEVVEKSLFDRNFAMANTVTRSDSSDTASVSLSPGELTASAELQVVFELVPPAGRS